MSEINWDRVERLLGAENLQRLAQAHVCVVGVGSGGGFVALSLAMSGVGRFTLVDDDDLESANVVRHVADLREVGRNKAAVVADLIRQRNPQAVVEVRPGRIEHHMDALDHCDLLIVGVDGEDVKYELNQACLERNLTAIYAGVYERGEGGDVVVIRPGKGPCYACWAANLRADLPQNAPQQELDYGMIGADGKLESEPGLWLHVVKIAAIQADFALTELLRGTGTRKPYPANTLIVANNEMEIIDGQPSPAHSTLWVEIERDPDCLVCGDAVNAVRQGSQQPFSLDDLAGSIDIQMGDEAGEASQGDRAQRLRRQMKP